MNYRFSFNICTIQFIISAPWYIREACAYLLTEDPQVYNQDQVVLNIYEISDKKVIFIFFNNEHNRIEKTIDKENTLFFFFVLLEQMIAENLIKKDSLLIFHGGCFSLQGNAVLVIQEKGAGKTTLISKMASCHDFNYLADDLAICCSNSLEIWALPLPLRLRTVNLKDFNLKGHFLGQCVDFNGNTRYLFLPDSWNLNKSRLKFILIPEYTGENINDFNCIPVNGIQQVKILTKNIKEISDIHNFYTGVLNIANNSKMYYCKYSGNIDWIAKQIKAFLYTNDI